MAKENIAYLANLKDSSKELIIFLLVYIGYILIELFFHSKCYPKYHHHTYQSKKFHYNKYRH